MDCSGVCLEDPLEVVKYFFRFFKSLFGVLFTVPLGSIVNIEKTASGFPQSHNDNKKQRKICQYH